jgi:hypothetical protein
MRLAVSIMRAAIFRSRRRSVETWAIARSRGLGELAKLAPVVWTAPLGFRVDLCWGLLNAGRSGARRRPVVVSLTREEDLQFLLAPELRRYAVTERRKRTRHEDRIEWVARPAEPKMRARRRNWTRGLRAHLISSARTTI